MALPRQNRVTPFGELIATECRGTLMGNRGCLHDEHQRIRRAFACRRWIACVLELRGRPRAVVGPLGAGRVRPVGPPAEGWEGSGAHPPVRRAGARAGFSRGDSPDSPGGVKPRPTWIGAPEGRQSIARGVNPWIWERNCLSPG